MITPASRAALISVDDRPATLFVEGQQVVDGVVLYALNPDGIVVKRGDEFLRLPLRGVQSAGSADAVQSGGSAGVELPAWATESVLLSPPSATEARRTYQNRD
jgi:hypothetical protein